MQLLAQRVEGDEPAGDLDRLVAPLLAEEVIDRTLERGTGDDRDALAFRDEPVLELRFADVEVLQRLPR